MKIYLISIGQRMPKWVNTAYSDYTKRLPTDYELILKSVPAEKRQKKANTNTIIARESEALLNACPANTHVIALDRQGKAMDSPAIATAVQKWRDQSQDIAVLIGGPDGISPLALQKTHSIWSLSMLTLPHPLVRVLIAEQLYRAVSILSNHPYHR